MDTHHLFTNYIQNIFHCDTRLSKWHSKCRQKWRYACLNAKCQKGSFNESDCNQTWDV